jgi:hypothetical protein
MLGAAEGRRYYSAEVWQALVYYTQGLDIPLAQASIRYMNPQNHATRRAKRPKLGLLAGILIYLGLVLGVTAGLFLVRVLLAVVAALVARYFVGAGWDTAIIAGLAGYLIASLIITTLDAFDWKRGRKVRTEERSAAGEQGSDH